MGNEEEQTRNEITRLLVSWGGGNKDALDQLTPIVYNELHRLALSYLNREHGRPSTLQATALVNEAYMRLVAQDLPDWRCRGHFYGVASRLMRQILVDHARKHRSAKRGAGAIQVQFEEALNIGPQRSPDLIRLDDALTELAKFDERKCKVIELRFFGGLGTEETAQALEISTATVNREQRTAEAWLHSYITSTMEKS